MDVRKPVLWLIPYGIVFVVTTFTGADLIARSRMSMMYFAAYCVINITIGAILLDKRYGIRTLLFFTLAAQFGFAASVIFVSMMTKSETGIITGSIFAFVFAATLVMMIVKSRKV